MSVLNSGYDIRLSPNVSSASGFSFNYKFISFSYGFIPKFLPWNDDDNIRGKTKGFAFGFGLNSRHWLQDFAYRKIRGFYLENTSDFNPNWKEGDPYVQFPDLYYTSYQGSTSYSTNKHFSVNAAATQTERQLRRAGSFIPRLYYRYYTVNDKSETDPGGSSQKSGNMEIVIGAGYYYTFVFRHNFYASLGATPGLGYIFTKLTTRLPDGEVVTYKNSPLGRVDGRAGLGYNGTRFFTGIYSNASASTMKQQNTTAVNNNFRITYQVFLGYRLIAPKVLAKNVEKVEKLIF